MSRRESETKNFEESLKDSIDLRDELSNQSDSDKKAQEFKAVELVKVYDETMMEMEKLHHERDDIKEQIDVLTSLKDETTTVT